jgi:probable HAF family extracellular repeat protein
MTRFLCGLVALVLLEVVTGQLKAQPTYNFTTLDAPGASFANTIATGINTSGQIVGTYSVPGYRDEYGSADKSRSFLFANGNYTTLDLPGSYGTSANGINTSGQIVGDYGDTAGHHGFLLDQGSYITLDVPGAIWTYAQGINDSGQIVGNSSLGAFLLDNGTYTILDVPGAISTGASGINASGQIVGSYQDASGMDHGFLLDQGTYTTLDVPGATATGANGISASGQSWDRTRMLRV